ncbi:MAG: lactonase family protein [Opitutaceae bacterium]|jgi:6-phosphogluconolactonase|nr:lactonase family protein [Opitutaceae bacterium]
MRPNRIPRIALALACLVLFRCGPMKYLSASGRSLVPGRFFLFAAMSSSSIASAISSVSPSGSASFPASAADTPPPAAWVGTYTKGSSRGIYRVPFDFADGRFGSPELVIELPSPSFLAFRPASAAGTPALYAVSESTATVSAFALPAAAATTAAAATGSPVPLNSAPTRGAGPCDVAVDATGRTLAVANYSGGSLAAWRLADDGCIEREIAFFQHTHVSRANPRRQEKPHVHGVTFSPDNRLLLVPDLGADRVYVYLHDAAASTLAPHGTAPWIELPPGSGPRHAVFSPDARHFYVINELGNTVSAFACDATAATAATAATTAATGTGTFAPVADVPTLPSGFAGESITAELAFSSDGLRLYASNRGHDSIAIFARDPATGRLTPAGHVSAGGRGPRHFTLTPDGRWLVVANQNSGNLAALRITPGVATAAATSTAAAAAGTLPLDAAVCVKFR